MHIYMYTGCPRIHGRGMHSVLVRAKGATFYSSKIAMSGHNFLNEQL